MKPGTAIVASLIFVALAACSPADDVPAAAAATVSPSRTSAAPPWNADPCLLIDSTTLATMFGELKEGPLPSTGLREERQCNYTNMNGSWLKLSLSSGMERWEWEKGITNAQNPKTLQSLGDEAFAIKRGTDSVVYVRRGSSILELSCSCSSDEAERIARKLAQ